MSAQCGGRAVRDDYQQTLISESVKISRYDMLRSPNGRGHVPSCRSGVRCSVAAMAALQ